MSDRLPTYIFVSALIRRANISGAPAFLLQKGDQMRGPIFVKVSRLNGTAVLFAPAFTMQGQREFENLSEIHLGEDESVIDAYIAEKCRKDADIWAIEIEDIKGRNFLDEDAFESVTGRQI